MRAKTARQVVSQWSDSPSFRTALSGLGYPTEEIAEPSTRTVDALVAHGVPDAVAAAAHAHLAAGADHVTLLLPAGTEFAAGIDQLARVAPALAGLT